MAKAPKTPSITNKTAILASKFTGSKMRSADKEGDEGGDAGDFEPGRKLGLSGIPVSEDFAAEVSQHPGIGNFMLDYGPDKKPKAPASERIGPIRIKEKFKGCKVTIGWGLSTKLEVKNARVSGIQFEAVGTVIHMRCIVQGLFPMSLETLELEERSGEQVRVWIKFGTVEDADQPGAGEQRDLVDEQNDDEASEETSPPSRPGPGMGKAAH